MKTAAAITIPLTWCQCYKPFHSCNLPISVISWSICPCRAFPV